ncbi:unnamed protein product [Ostreobium quekettii]|uniref:Ribophorin II n=1 Tax=Ostreobium quekettii TaxID=121088 RepID=A0A8S1IRE9_9CHLO|nr:unnamed protein product [Ostreobium quekettii]
MEVAIQNQQGDTTETFTEAYPKSALSEYKLSFTTSMKVSFNVSTKSSKVPIAPQQAFVLLTSKATGSVAYFVAHGTPELLMASVGTSDLHVQTGGQGGIFNVDILIGDPSAAGGVLWNLGTVDVFQALTSSGAGSGGYLPPRYLHKPSKKIEIEHIHRIPDKRPAPIIPVVFTGMVMLPLGALLTALVGLRLNVKGFPSGAGSVWATLFHTGIAAVLVLYIVFWLQLNLLRIIPALAVLSLFCIITGHKALSAVMAMRLKKD